MKTAVLLMFAILVPPPEAGITFIDYSDSGIPHWYADHPGCDAGRDRLYQLIQAGRYLDGVPAGHLWCLSIPMQGLLGPALTGRRQ